MSIPSASCSVQMGVMVFSASAVSRQERPAMEPESSIRKTVSKVERKEKSLSSTSFEAWLDGGMTGEGWLMGGAAE